MDIKITVIKELIIPKLGIKVLYTYMLFNFLFNLKKNYKK